MTAASSLVVANENKYTHCSRPSTIYVRKNRPIRWRELSALVSCQPVGSCSVLLTMTTAGILRLQMIHRSPTFCRLYRMRSTKYFKMKPIGVATLSQSMRRLPSSHRFRLSVCASEILFDLSCRILPRFTLPIFFCAKPLLHCVRMYFPNAHTTN